jgi:hypothetical protein
MSPAISLNMFVGDSFNLVGSSVRGIARIRVVKKRKEFTVTLLPFGGARMGPGRGRTAGQARLR